MWERKHCAICRSNFAVHPNAKTVDTRTRCAPCRKAMVEARKRERGLQIGRGSKAGKGTTDRLYGTERAWLEGIETDRYW